MKALLKISKSQSGFDSAKTGIHARSRTATLLGFLCQLSANAIKCGLDAGLLARHNLEATLHSNVRRFDLNN